MSTETEITEYKVDRTGWAAGPWDSEPDRLEWRAHGLPCLIARNDMGALCGYVAVPPGHPAHGANRSDLDVSVHGGLTYSDVCAGHICHVPAPGEPDNVYWLGFDCAHAWDLSPGIVARFRRHGAVAEHGTTYRDISYVRAEVEGLAEQLAAMAPSAAPKFRVVEYLSGLPIDGEPNEEMLRHLEDSLQGTVRAFRGDDGKWHRVAWDLPSPNGKPTALIYVEAAS